MKKYLFTLSFLLLATALFAQRTSQEETGYIYISDAQQVQYRVAYVTPFLTCKFSVDSDKREAEKAAMEAEFRAFLAENYEVVKLDERTNRDWFMNMRGRTNEGSYKNFLESGKEKGAHQEIIVVNDFVATCPNVQ
ncbi:MAG: hypothetical protein KTR13_01145 [Saprospiraceae bacterium]|nr:hypothetical protein [Saprospiraceae bacterium]